MGYFYYPVIFDYPVVFSKPCVQHDQIIEEALTVLTFADGTCEKFRGH